MQVSRARRLATYGAILLLAIWTLFPLYWMFLTSIKTHIDVISIPPKFVFKPTSENYQSITIGKKVQEAAGWKMARPEFPSYFKNSLIISGGAALLSMLIGVPAAYGFARFRFPLKENIAFTIMSFRFAPELVIIIPLYVVFRTAGLYNTYGGLILVYQLVGLPLLIWMLRGFFEDIPVEVEQAAKLDGYSWWGIYTKVALPMAAPGVAAAAVLTFIFAWNSFIFGLILAGRETMPVTVGLLAFIAYEQVLWGQMAAATIVGIIPQLVLALIIQRWIVRGLTFGAVKG